MRIPGLKSAKSIAHRLRDRLFPGGIILMYHRIADSECDPWGNCVSPQNFREQLDVINRHAEPQSLHNLTTQLVYGRPLRARVALTFDDGYIDNFYTARRLLQEYDTHATFFLVTGRMGSINAYWWDDLADILLCTVPLPEYLSLTITNAEYGFSVGNAATGDDADRVAQDGRRAWNAEPGSRLASYYEIWKLLRSLNPAERTEALSQVRRWAGFQQREINKPVSITAEQANELASEGLIEIGSHSRSHPSLPDLDTLAQKHEIESSKLELEEIINGPVESFAYPYGDFNEITPGLVKNAGYQSACTVISSHVTHRNDNFLLPRIAAMNCGGDEFEKQIFKFFGI